VRLTGVAACIAVLELAGACTAVGPNFKSPDAPKTSAYAMAGDPATQAVALGGAETPGRAWWTALGSPSLDAVIAQALADSPTLAEADATLAQAASALNEARGTAGPQASVNAGVSRERANLQAFGISSFGGVPLVNPTFNLYSVGGVVGYDLDLFGGQRRRVEAAQARAQAAGRRADAAYLTLTANVALQAVTIATANAHIAAIDDMVRADQSNLELVAKANALGGSTKVAEVGAQSQLEEDRALLPPRRRELATAKHALALLVGHAPADWTAPEFTLSEMAVAMPVPLSLPSELVRRRPDIRAAEADLHAATADIGVATADLYPDIKLTASLTQGALHPGDLFSYDVTAWDLGAGLTAPIFDGGALRARRQQMREAARAASARYQRTVINAFTQVADALSDLATDDEALAADQRAQAQADENLRLARSAFRLGGGTLLGVLDAQRRAHQAQAALVQDQGRRLADIVRLYAASGADWRRADGR
jgi:NodT family efflux transporter outer membrane factor (OMF) lipoprotein